MRKLLAILFLCGWGPSAPADGADLIPNTGGQWPAWSGPYGHHAAVDCADELVTDMTKAKVAWVSEGYFKGPNDCHKHCNLMGSPIVAEGKVFVFYYEVTDEFIDQKTMAKNAKRKHFDPDTAKVYARDRLHAMDFRTGRKLWDVVLPRRGVNWPNLNWAARMQLVYGDGRVYVQGSSGAVYGVDAKTGKLVWQNEHTKEITATFDSIEKAIRDGKASAYSMGGCGVSKKFTTVPAFVDGVVVFAVDSEGYAFDAKTGKRLWTKPGFVGGIGADILALHRPGHKPAFITCPRKVTATDAHTGKTLWSVDPVHGGNKVSRYGDYIIVNGPPGGRPQWCGVALIKVQGGVGKLLWSYLEVSTQRHLVPSVHRGHVFVYGDNGKKKYGGYKCFHLQTGKLVKSFEGRKRWRDHHAVLSNGKLYHFGGVVNADPAEFRELGDEPQGKVALPTPTYPDEPNLRPLGYLSPLIVDGYFIARGPYRVLCWDLRAGPREAREER